MVADRRRFSTLRARIGDTRHNKTVVSIAFFLLLVVLFIFSDDSHAALPDAPRFTLTPPTPTPGTTIETATQFVVMCTQNADATTGFVEKLRFPPTSQTLPTVMQAAPGLFADGVWTCYADTVFASTPVAWKASNKVTFTVTRAVVKVQTPWSIGVN